MSYVVISGKASSGKNTVSKYFEREHFVNVAFADELKRIMVRLFGFTNEQMFGSSEKRKECSEKLLKYGIDISGRLVSQKIGTDCFREIYKNVWVDFFLDITNQLLENPKLGYDQTIGLIPLKKKKKIKGIVASDARFLNEFRVMKSNGATFIRIIRPSESDQTIEEWQKHSSENDLLNLGDDEFDYTIHNDGTLEDLQVKVEKIIKHMKERGVFE